MLSENKQGETWVLLQGPCRLVMNEWLLRWSKEQHGTTNAWQFEMLWPFNFEADISRKHKFRTTVHCSVEGAEYRPNRRHCGFPIRKEPANAL